MNERDSDRHNEEERNGHAHTKWALMEMVNYSEATDSHHYWLLLVDFAIYLYNVNNHKCSLTYTIHNIKKYLENKHINSNHIATADVKYKIAQTFVLNYYG